MAAIDVHAGQSELLSSPYDNAAEITPSDTADLAYATRALWCGVAGNVKVTMLGGGTPLVHHQQLHRILQSHQTHTGIQSHQTSYTIHLS